MELISRKEKYTNIRGFIVPIRKNSPILILIRLALFQQKRDLQLDLAREQRMFEDLIITVIPENSNNFKLKLVASVFYFQQICKSASCLVVATPPKILDSPFPENGYPRTCDHFVDARDIHNDLNGWDIESSMSLPNASILLVADKFVGGKFDNRVLALGNPDFKLFLKVKFLETLLPKLIN